MMVFFHVSLSEFKSYSWLGSEDHMSKCCLLYFNKLGGIVFCLSSQIVPKYGVFFHNQMRHWLMRGNVR